MKFFKNIHVHPIKNSELISNEGKQLSTSTGEALSSSSSINDETPIIPSTTPPRKKSFFLPPDFIKKSNYDLKNIYSHRDLYSTSGQQQESFGPAITPLEYPGPETKHIILHKKDPLGSPKTKTKSRIFRLLDRYLYRGRKEFRGSSSKGDEDAAPCFLPKKIRKRLVNKSGSTNVIHSHIPKLKQHFLTDIYTTLLDSKWRWAIGIFAAGFLVSWFTFAFIWWLVLFSHDDFSNINNPNWKPCVKNIETFAGVFLFSVETQHTIGFGYRYPTEECPEAILVFIIQCITGTLVQGFITGMMFAKLCRPKKRAATLMFSKNAVICTRDGQLCLCVRFGDMRTSHMIGAHARAYMFRKKITLEGEVIHLKPYVINVGTNPPDDNIFLVWPVIVYHIIDEQSPFYDMGAEELKNDHFEVVFIFEGMVEATGASMQARTSYLPHEILWGYRFERLARYITEAGNLAINYTLFHNIISVNIPQCSSRTLESLRRKFFEEEERIKEQVFLDDTINVDQTKEDEEKEKEDSELTALLKMTLERLDRLEKKEPDTIS